MPRADWRGKLPVVRSIYTGQVVVSSRIRYRIAAIRFLNPAPLMWDFEHPSFNRELAERYDIEYMLPSECAERLETGASDIGLVPIAALPREPKMRVLPGCTIASKHRVRSLLLVRREDQPLENLKSVAADTASRTTLTYARLLFHRWGNPDVPFHPMAANLDAMLDQAEAAIVIGDPALAAMEDRQQRQERTGEKLVYHDLAEEWRVLTGLPFVSAVWGTTAPAGSGDERVIEDLIRSRDHGLKNIDALAEEWSQKTALPRDTIATYLTENIHYVLDEECVEGMRGFFQEAARLGVLPEYEFGPAKLMAG